MTHTFVPCHDRVWRLSRRQFSDFTMNIAESGYLTPPHRGLYNLSSGKC